MLKRYDYPNNVQELLTIVASVVAREESDMINFESLPHHISRGFQARNMGKI
jgi:DNA-binding NtrC family response regulator